MIQFQAFGVHEILYNLRPIQVANLKLLLSMMSRM